MEESSVNCVSSENNISLRPESGSLIHYTATNLDKSKTKNPNASKGTENYASLEPYKYDGNKQPQTNKRSHKQSCLEMIDRINAEEEADRHCSKTFHLKDSSSHSCSQWTLPSLRGLYTHDVWMVEELQMKKDDLNKIKSQLDNYDIETWHQHTYNCNPAQKIAFAVKCRAKPELLTQAFLKFFEILHSLPVVPDVITNPDSEFNSLHLCEAPGAFVVALNHFLALHRPNMKLNWVANTLNPYYEGTPSSECITDDRFILHTLDNWCFGQDDTGNLMSTDYLEELEARMGGKKVDLVTADGSIDCQANPSEQESMTQCLHFCEVFAALGSLREGGSFVLKTFTFFESESVNLMYLISCCFRDVHVLKPITSKLGNSEVYIVATGFSAPQGLNDYLEALSVFYGKRMVKKTLFSREEIPQTFLYQIINCCEFFKTHQAQAIQRNVSLYENHSTWNEQYCSLLKTIVQRKYFEITDCRLIDPSRRLVAHKLDWDKNIIPKSSYTKWGEQIRKKPKHVRLQFLNDQIEKLNKEYALNIDMSKYITHDVSVAEWLVETMSFGKGQPLHFVYISRFCNPNLMHTWKNYLLECVTEDEMEYVKKSHTPISICSGEFFLQYISEDFEDSRREILETYPEALILDEGNFPAPHACYVSFNHFFELIKDGKVSPGTNIAILHCPLFTRLQNGLLCIFASLFEKLTFWDPVNISERSPFFVFKNFTSIEKGKRLSCAMVDMGWLVDREQIIQVIPMKSLIRSRLHTAVCRYNAIFCLRNLHFLRRYQSLSET